MGPRKLFYVAALFFGINYCGATGHLPFHVDAGNTSGNLPTPTLPVPRLQIASFSDCLRKHTRIMVASNIALCVRTKLKFNQYV